MSWSLSNTWHLIRSGSPSFSSPYDFGFAGMYIHSQDSLLCSSSRSMVAACHCLQLRAFHLTPTSTSTASRFGFLSYSVASHTSRPALVGSSRASYALSSPTSVIPKASETTISLQKTKTSPRLPCASNAINPSSTSSGSGCLRYLYPGPRLASVRETSSVYISFEQ